MYLQKTDWQSFSANRKSHTASKKIITYRNDMFIVMDVREGNFSKKTLLSQGERLIKKNYY